MRQFLYFISAVLFSLFSLIFIKGLEKPEYLIDSDQSPSFSQLISQCPGTFLDENSQILTNSENTRAEINYGKKGYIRILKYPSQKEGYSQLIIPEKDKKGEITYRVDTELLSHYESQVSAVSIRDYFKTGKGYWGYYVLDQGVLVSVYARTYTEVSQLISDLPFFISQENSTQKFISSIQSTSPFIVPILISLFLVLSLYFLFIFLKSLTLVFRFKKGEQKRLDKEGFIDSLLKLNEEQAILKFSRNRKYNIIVDWNYLNEDLIPIGERQDIKKVYRLGMIFLQKKTCCLVYLIPCRIHYRANRKRQILFSSRFNFLGKRPLDKHHKEQDGFKLESPLITLKDIKESHFNPSLFLKDIQKKAVSEGWGWRPQLFPPLFRKKDGAFSSLDS